jgi:hypothetical protein
MTDKSKSTPDDEGLAKTADDSNAGQPDVHSDTGKRLCPGDEKTLEASEKMARMQRDGCGRFPSAMDRVMRDLQEQERQFIALSRTLNPGAELDQIRRAEPLLDNPVLGDRLQQIQQQQKLIDVALEPTARAIRKHMDMFEQQRRYLEPLLDGDFVRRVTGGLDADLMQRAMALLEPDALRLVREQVDTAAARLITDHWVILDQTREHGEMIASATAFTRDVTAMAGEVQRMLSVYGPVLAEQTGFLTEYRSNLGLFHTAGLTKVAYERADLLARIAMPATLATGFDGYNPSNVERVQAYGESVLRELEADFGRDSNPVHAWEALAVARRYGIDPPHWVKHFLFDAADRILEIRDEVAGGRPVNRESERVGKALGFGKDGPGQGGWFKHATMLERDRTIYFEISDKLVTGMKLDFAYDEVAKASSVSRSTIVRAYLRIMKLKDKASDQIKGEGELS